MNIETIRQRVESGDYFVKAHAVQHAIKEGFDRRNMVEAIRSGKIIESYPAEQRVLICGTPRFPICELLSAPGLRIFRRLC